MARRSRPSLTARVLTASGAEIDRFTVERTSGQRLGGLTLGADIGDQ